MTTGTAVRRSSEWLDEAALLESLREGDEAACEALVRDHTARLLAVARRYLRQEEDARDAVQEAYVAAFRSIARFEGGSSLSTWLHRIVINCCLMKLRTGRRRPETSIEELLPRFDETGHRVLDEAAWPDIEEMSTEEAARLLGLTENALKIRLHRARQALRSLLLKEGLGSAAAQVAAQA
jgi:RNA polymerase sigma-70 factor (ECF subfamily)